MKKKYELTNETIKHLGVILHRIRALRDIPKYNIKAGDLGGYIETEDNLSQYGDAWIGNNAKIFEDARVYGNACVCGNADISGRFQISGNAYISSVDDLFIVGPIGSRNDYITFYKTKYNNIGVACIRFNGTIDEFIKKVKETHGNIKHAVLYRMAIKMARIRIKLD